MPFDAKIFRVMIASPSDVISEREIVRDVLAEWNAIHADKRGIVFLPVGWETNASPSMGERPQAIINKQILKDADLLVGVFWTRLGTATGAYPSGTVEEIEEHIASGKPAMLYFSRAPVMPESIEPDQYAALNKFRDSCKDRGLLDSYSSAIEFQGKFYRQLQLILNQDAYFGAAVVPTLIPSVVEDRVIGVSPSPMQLSQEARTLLKEASLSHNGEIRRIAVFRGLQLLVNGKNVIEGNNPRERATWEAAVEELERQDLIKSIGFERRVFRVTKYGFEVAEQLINEEKKAVLA